MICFDLSHFISESFSENSYKTQRSSSYKQKRLNHVDMPLYGECQDKEIFSVVTCHKCEMVLKQQAFNDHLKKRHNSFSLSDEFYSSSDDTYVSSDNAPVVPVSFLNEQTAKRRKVDNSSDVESYPLVSCPSKVLSQHERKFIKPKPNKPTQTVKKRESEKAAAAQSIRLKLRKSDHGTWSVANV